MNFNKIHSCLTGLVLSVSLFTISQADTAAVLPKGVSQIEVAYYHYANINTRYDPGGKTEDVAVDFNGALDSTVFPALVALDQFVGSANIGNSIVDFTYLYQTSDITYNYGLSKNLSIGFKMPYFKVKNKVTTSLDTSTANVGRNPLWETAMDPVGAPLVPLGTGIGETPLAKEDLLNLLSSGLDVNGNGTIDIPGFGYKSFKTTSSQGIGDIEIGTKYKYHDKGSWSMAFASGVRFPTGRADDTDNLVDISYGGEQADLLIRMHWDFRGFDKWLFNTSVYATMQLPDHITKRVPSDVNEPITTNRERVHRDLGDIYELEISSNYAFSPQWSTNLKYRYSKKQPDHVGGTQGFFYESLERETAWQSQIIALSVGYSSMKKYMAKQSSVPLYVALTYRNRFNGQNNAFKSSFVGLVFGVFFK